MRRRQFLAGLFAFALAAVFAFGGIAMAKGNKNKNKDGSGNEFTGIVNSISKTQIVLMSDDKTKTKVFSIDEKTTITGDIAHGTKVTVSYSGNKATSISVAS